MKINKKTIKYLAIALICLGVLGSLYINNFRFQAEKHNDTVEILLDFDEVASLAKANGLSFAELGKNFREAGATGVLMRERTLENLQVDGDVVVLKGNEAALVQQIGGQVLSDFELERDKTYLFFQDETIYQTVFQHLQVKKADVTEDEAAGYYVIAARLYPEEFEKLGVGFMPRDLQAVEDMGLSIVPRIKEWYKPSQEALDAMFTEVAGMKDLSMVTFNDTAIPGTNMLPYMSEKMKELQVPVGMFEFYKQVGLQQLAFLTDKNAVRVHTISTSDMARYSEKPAIERFNLAVTERNIRVLLVRFFGIKHPETALTRNVNFVQQVTADLEAEGMKIGKASRLESLPYSRLIILLIGLGVVGAGILAINSLFPAKWTLLLSGVGMVGWAGLLYLSPLLARKGFALLSVLVFPVVGIIALQKQEQRSFKGAVLALLQMSGFSLVGALIMTGLLADKSFMLTLDGFSGVKLAHLLPLALVPLYFFFKDGNPVAKVEELLESVVKQKHLIIGAVLAAALVVYIVRTGNDAPQLVSSWETAFRDALDRILGVRPRTKEFLVGHPAMLVLLYYGFNLNRIWLLFFGIIGQVSLVNTYAHIHTPLTISFLRSFNGLWLGILLGAAVIVVVNLSIKWYKRRLAK